MIDLDIATDPASPCWLSDDLGRLIDSLKTYDFVEVVADENTRLYGEEIVRKLSSSKACISVVPAGEGSKSFGVLESLCESISTRISRKSAVVGVGGGVIGDLAGFCSSILFRGVDYFLVPTSLLAMVDSSIGGKTGINLSTGKNLVGNFITPRGIFLNLDSLKTLKTREIWSGVGEMVKHCLLDSEDSFEEFCQFLDQLDPQKPGSLKDWILHSIGVKKSVVEKDFKEGGLRKVLNLGHTIGHGIEMAQKFSIPHGVCVLMGILIEQELANSLELGSSLTEPLNKILRYSGFASKIPGLESYLPFLSQDKKNVGGEIHFVFLEAPGKIQDFSGTYSYGMEYDRLSHHLSQICLETG